MTAETGAAPSAPPIDLTAAPDFALGAARVRPSTCEVLGPDGAIRLQHKVMQVLVALADAAGTAVSRDVLRARCWGGQVVGDDSINRCVQRLRQLSQVEAPGSFTLETLPRLGYRLTAKGMDSPAHPLPRGKSRRAWRVWAAGAAVLALGGVAAVFSRQPAPARWSVQRFEPLVSTPLLERHPALSPDGKMLAYSAGPDIVGRHIYLKPLAGGNPIQLTDDGFDDTAPAWSPDGGRLVYVASRAGEPCRIMITATPAGLARQLARCQGAERSHAVWSPRGDALMFSDASVAGGPARIMRLDLGTGRRAAISHPPGGLDDREPAVSPDGRWLFFIRDSSETSARLVIHDLKNGRERTVAVVDMGSGGAAWAEDSRSLFVVGANDTESTLWSYPIAGGRRAVVAILPLTIGRLASGPGGLLAAEIVVHRLNAARPPGHGETAPAVIDPANGETLSPAYSSDGTLAVASNRSGNSAVWLIPPGSPSRLLMTFSGEYPLDLSWSPDGDQLALVALRGQAIEVRVVGSAGEARASIPVPGVEAGRPAWSADGRALVFPVRDGGGWRLWRSDLAQPARPRPITGYGWAAARAAGDALYAVRADRPGVWRLGAPPRLIAAGFSGRYREAWTIFKNEVVFAEDGKAGRPRLLSVPLSGGPARPFAALPDAAFEPDFAIDPRSGTPAYIAVISSESDIELLHLARR